MLSDELKQIVEQNIKLIEEYRFNELYRHCPYNEVRNELTMMLHSIDIDPLKFFEKEIPKYVCLRNNTITEVRIPEGIVKIDYGAFLECSKLEKVYLPSSIADLTIGTFEKSSRLKEVYYNGTSENWQNVKWSLNPFKDTQVTHIICTDKVIEWNPYKEVK